MEKVIFYTIHCTACDELQLLLDEKGVDYTLIDNVNDVIEIANKHNIETAPILKVDSMVYDYNSAINWVREHN